MELFMGGEIKLWKCQLELGRGEACAMFPAATELKIDEMTDHCKVQSHLANNKTPQTP